MKTLPATIYRAEGFLYLHDVPSRKEIVHVVGKRARLIISEPWGDEKPGTQLVFIGEEGGIDDCELQSRFDACQTEKDPHQDTASDADLDLLRPLPMGDVGSRGLSG